MKQKIQMTPDEFRTYVASEVESIRTEIEQLRFTAENRAGSLGMRGGSDAVPGAGTLTFVPTPSLPRDHKVPRG
jgi:hypothetical protein